MIMVQKEILLSKISRLERHLSRIREKRGVGLDQFLRDIDCQESILFNLQHAIQNCIDIAAHVVSEESFGLAGSLGELFYFLEEKGVLTPSLTEKMIRAVGFRNLIVHEYGKLDLTAVYRIAQENIGDIEEFVRSVGKKFG